MIRHNTNVDTCGRIFAKSHMSGTTRLVKGNYRENVDMRPHVSQAPESVTRGTNQGDV